MNSRNFARMINVSFYTIICMLLCHVNAFGMGDTTSVVRDPNRFKPSAQSEAEFKALEKAYAQKFKEKKRALSRMDKAISDEKIRQKAREKALASGNNVERDPAEISEREIEAYECEKAEEQEKENLLYHDEKTEEVCDFYDDSNDFVGCDEETDDEETDDEDDDGYDTYSRDDYLADQARLAFQAHKIARLEAQLRARDANITELRSILY